MNTASEIWQVEGHSIPVSHLEKVFWPAAGFTKQDMLRYYLQIAPVALPHFRDRPVTLRVFPEGTSGASFYQRELPSHAPSWIAAEVYHPKTGDSGAKTPRTITTPLINDAASLIWLANGGCVEFHLWSARAPHLDLPDQAIFDLDPGENAPFSRVLEAGLRLREHLERLGIASYAKTSGGRGLHVYAPLAPVHPYVDVRQWVNTTAQQLAADYPTLVAAAHGATHRGDYVTIDYAQNSIGRNTAAPYTIRAGASIPRVSAPLSWEEIAADIIRPDDLTPDVALERVQRYGDLFAPALLANQRLPGTH
ncbi:MAG TPA: non-homologous end-joining DNA ligase [Ktedonobacterales bacterium]